MRYVPSVIVASALVATCAAAQWQYATSAQQDAETVCMYLAGDPFETLRKSTERVTFTDGEHAVIVSAQPIGDVLAEFPSYRPKVLVGPDRVLSSENAEKISFLNGMERKARFVNRSCNWLDRNGHQRPGGYALRIDLYEHDALVRTLLDIGSKNGVTRISSERCNNMHTPSSRDDNGSVLFASENTEMPFGSIDTIIEYEESDRRAIIPEEPWKALYTKIIRAVAKEAKAADDHPWAGVVGE